MQQAAGFAFSVLICSYNAPVGSTSDEKGYGTCRTTLRPSAARRAKTTSGICLSPKGNPSGFNGSGFDTVPTQSGGAGFWFEMAVSMLELWTSLMFKCQQSRPRGLLVHADAPVRAQRPGENRIMTAAAAAVGPRFFIAGSLAPGLEVGLHFDRKAKEVFVSATVFRRTGHQVVRIAGLVRPDNYRSLNWSFESH